MRLRRIFPSVAGFLFFILMGLFYCFNEKSIYGAILKLWGVRSFDFPFVDTDTVLSAVRCLNRGIDVYVVNPCDVLGRVYDYSPLWMVLTIFPMTPRWLSPIGLGLDVVFLGSLLLLPPCRRWADTVIVTLGVVSSATVFAVERGNNDLLLFVLDASAASLVRFSPAIRLLGYGFALLAGLLKYYPMAVLAIVLRERTVRFWGITLAAVAITFCFVIVTWHDLSRALAIIPTGSYFSDMFGAITVAGGLTQRLHLPHIVQPILRDAMTLGALALGIRIGLQRETIERVQRLSEAERNFLLVGALLILAAFFTAQNIGYRAIHLILILPALCAIRRHSASGWMRLLPFAAVLILWSEGWRNGAMSLAPMLGAHWHGRMSWLCWLIRESLWWWLTKMLIALIVASLRDSAAVTAIILPFGHRYGSSA